MKFFFKYFFISLKILKDRFAIKGLFMTPSQI